MRNRRRTLLSAVSMVLLLSLVLLLTADANALVGIKHKGDIGRMSEEKAAAMREVMQNDKERIKEEKRRIIEDTKTERPVRKRRPFEPAYNTHVLPKSLNKIHPLEPHQALLAKRPFLTLFILILLAFISYNIHKSLRQNINTPH